MRLNARVGDDAGPIFKVETDRTAISALCLLLFSRLFGCFCSRHGRFDAPRVTMILYLIVIFFALIIYVLFFYNYSLVIYNIYNSIVEIVDIYSLFQLFIYEITVLLYYMYIIIIIIFLFLFYKKNYFTLFTCHHCISCLWCIVCRLYHHLRKASFVQWFGDEKRKRK